MCCNNITLQSNHIKTKRCCPVNNMDTALHYKGHCTTLLWALYLCWSCTRLQIVEHTVSIPGFWVMSIDEYCLRLVVVRGCHTVPVWAHHSTRGRKIHIKNVQYSCNIQQICTYVHKLVHICFWMCIIYGKTKFLKEASALTQRRLNPWCCGTASVRLAQFGPGLTCTTLNTRPATYITANRLLKGSL